MLPTPNKTHPNIDFPLPVTDYPMSEFERGAAQSAPAASRVEQPMNTNPEISTPAPSPEKFGMGRGPNGAA